MQPSQSVTMVQFSAGRWASECREELAIDRKTGEGHRCYGAALRLRASRISGVLVTKAGEE